MREIKFRARSTHGGYWWYGSTLVDHTDYGTNTLPMSEFWHWVETSVLDPKTVGQYTGLKDKNGVEIYEGDVGKFKINTRWGYIYLTGVVRCESLADGCVVCFLPLEADGHPLDFDLVDLEVIGNIYENPELLAGEKK